MGLMPHKTGYPNLPSMGPFGASPKILKSQFGSPLQLCRIDCKELFPKTLGDGLI
jgi:hypothetical protein